MSECGERCRCGNGVKMNHRAGVLVRRSRLRSPSISHGWLERPLRATLENRMRSFDLPPLPVASACSVSML